MVRPEVSSNGFQIFPSGIFDIAQFSLILNSKKKLMTFFFRKSFQIFPTETLFQKVMTFFLEDISKSSLVKTARKIAGAGTVTKGGCHDMVDAFMTTSLLKLKILKIYSLTVHTYVLSLHCTYLDIWSSSYHTTPAAAPPAWYTTVTENIISKGNNIPFLLFLNMKL